MADKPPKDPPKDGPQPIPPERRRRLQQCFEHGSKSAAGGNYDYATEMFTMCVQGDPGNLIYVQNFLGNLQKKYGNNKKGSKLAGLKGATVKGSISKAGMQKDWKGVITSGLEMLKLNPWDLQSLKAMGNACEQLQFDEVQLAYLKLAQDVDITDVDVNRLYARALGRLGRFDEAIVCWTRVQKVSPRDEEANRSIANLTVEKTIHRGGYEDAESSTEVMVDKRRRPIGKGRARRSSRPSNSSKRRSPRIPRRSKIIRSWPTCTCGTTVWSWPSRSWPKRYRYRAAKSRSANGSRTCSCAEPATIWRLRRARANRKDRGSKESVAANGRSPEPHRAGSLSQPLGSVSRQRRPEIRAGPAIAARKVYAEAIKVYQQSMADTKRKAAIHLGLGECFLGIKQYKLAMSNFEQAVAATNDRDLEQKKLALYWAGKLALFMKNFDVAEKYLTELAGLDFSYKDVGDLLDKLNQLREDGGSPG